MSTQLGKWLIVIGLIIVAAGLLIWLLGDRLGWLGNLPGDIRVEGDNYGFYFPISTMIIVSVVLSILFSILVRVFGD